MAPNPYTRVVHGAHRLIDRASVACGTALIRVGERLADAGVHFMNGPDFIELLQGDRLTRMARLLGFDRELDAEFRARILDTAATPQSTGGPVGVPHVEA